VSRAVEGQSGEDKVGNEKEWTTQKGAVSNTKR